jgi:hypothetical protein
MGHSCLDKLLPRLPKDYSPCEKEVSHLSDLEDIPRQATACKEIRHEKLYDSCLLIGYNGRRTVDLL